MNKLRHYIVFILIQLFLVGEIAQAGNDKVLIKAIKQNNKEYILQYLNEGGDPDLKVGKNAIPLLFYTIRYNTPDIAYILLEHNANPNEFYKEKPLLIWTVKKNQPGIARLLLMYGANVNASDQKGNTALITAAWMDSKKTARLLLNFGASIRQTDIHGNTAIDYANYPRCCETGYYLNMISKYQSKTQVNESYQDGPHVFYLNDSTVNVSYFNFDKCMDTSYRFVKTLDFKNDSLTFEHPSNKGETFTIFRKHEETPDFYSGVEKIFAVNDIHGNYNQFVEILINNKIIDKRSNWTWGRGHLVIVGDVFDRGDNVTETLWLIYKLEKQARKAGGYVHFLLGNHEIMVLMGKSLYLSKKYKHLTYHFDYDYTDFYKKNTELGKWLRTRKTLVKINDNLFVHGGISYPFYTELMSIQSINTYTHMVVNMESGSKLTEKTKIFLGDLGPFWYRGYVWNPDEKKPITEDQLDEILKFYQVSHIIIGHTLIKKIQTLFHDKIIAISSPFQEKAYLSHGLLIKGEQYFKAEFDGKSIRLF